MRTLADQFAVAHHAQQKQRREIEHDLLVETERHAAAACDELIDDNHAADGRQGGQGKLAPPIPARMIEADDERQQVQRQRHDPQKRNHGDVLADVIRRRQQHQRSQRRQEHPRQPPPSVGRRLAVVHAGRFVADGRRLGSRHRGHRAQHGKSHEARAPQGRLSQEIELRLHQKRIAKQTEQRADVREGIQAVRRPPGKRAGKPRLHKRARRGNGEIRHADRHGQQRQDAPRGRIAGGQLPAFIRHDRQQGHRQRQQPEMNQHLPPRPQRLQHVGIRITGKQHGLKKHHARGPHCPGYPRTTAR